MHTMFYAMKQAYDESMQIKFHRCHERNYHRIVPAQPEHRCIDCDVRIVGEKRNIRHRGLKHVAFAPEAS